MASSTDVRPKITLACVRSVGRIAHQPDRWRRPHRPEAEESEDRPRALPETFAELAERPEAKNLVTIYAALADTTTDAVMADYGGKGSAHSSRRWPIWRWRSSGRSATG